MKLFIVGGFLGSGKTTAIVQATTDLQEKAKKIGIVTNDQGEQLVDTQFLRQQKIAVEEVTGGCFCCNYKELYEKIHLLQHSEQPDIIFAESVGSCTDLVATVINPLLHFNKGEFDIVFSVFADIRVLYAYLQEDKLFQSNVNYIYEKQLEEADIIVVNKTDLLDENQLQAAKSLIEKRYVNSSLSENLEEAGQKKILYQSSLTREGIQQWITALFDNKSSSHSRQALQLNYERYGRGEAELAWLDKTISIYTQQSNAVDAGITLINSIYNRIIKGNYPIGHLKFLMDDGQQKIKVSFTSIAQNEQSVEFDYFETDKVTILINARVQIVSALLKNLVEEAIDELKFLTGCKVVAGKSDAFHPGFPKPVYRIVN